MSLPIIDLAQIHQVLPPSLSISEILTLFSKILTDDYPKITAAFAQQDFKTVAFLLEGLWESSLYCGVLKLSALLKESYMLSQQATLSQSKLEIITAEIGVVQAAIENFLLANH